MTDGYPKGGDCNATRPHSSFGLITGTGTNAGSFVNNSAVWTLVVGGAQNSHSPENTGDIVYSAQPPFPSPPTAPSSAGLGALVIWCGAGRLLRRPAARVGPFLRAAGSPLDRKRTRGEESGNGMGTGSGRLVDSETEKTRKHAQSPSDRPPRSGLFCAQRGIRTVAKEREG